MVDTVLWIYATACSTVVPPALVHLMYRWSGFKRPAGALWQVVRGYGLLTLVTGVGAVSCLVLIHLSHDAVLGGIAKLCAAVMLIATFGIIALKQLGRGVS